MSTELSTATVFTPSDPQAACYFLQFLGDKTGLRFATDTPPETIRAMICEVEAQMASAVAVGDFKDANTDYKLVHHFTPGVYGREMHIPAGHWVVGKLHKHELLNFITQGKVLVLTEQTGMCEYTAPVTFTSPRGTKRLLFTLEDTVWTGIHPTDSTDLDQIEHEFIALSYADIGLPNPQRLLESLV